jgi:hypothetical protein
VALDAVDNDSGVRASVRSARSVRWWRVLITALLAPLLSLIFAGAFSRETWPFWANFPGQLIGFILAGWIAARVARGKAWVAVALGLGLVWIPIIVAVHSRVPAHDSAAVLTYLIAAVLTAFLVGRRSGKQRRRSVTSPG